MPPDQTEILKWTGAGFDTNTYYVAYDFWSPNGDATLLPGEAAFFINPTSSSVTIPFAGLVLQGQSANAIVPGINYISSILPMAGRIHSDLCYNPNVDDKVLFWTGTGFSTNTYNGSTWSLGEPVLGVGQGFVLVASKTNNWVTNFSACQPGLFCIVTANPLWTDTGIHINPGDLVSFLANGSWNGGAGQCGPCGLPSGSHDPFLTNVASDFSLIAFVGANPYDWGTTNEWGNPNYFPQGASTNGYWPVGNAPNEQFTTDRGGELWFGFNDDAVDKVVGDNSGFVDGFIQISGP